MEQTTLKRNISLFQALMTVVGTVIGAGVFFKISIITAQTESASLTIFVWVLAGLISIASGLTVSELATALPVTGGPIKYIEYTYGPLLGFLFGWAQILIYFPANIAALSIIFATQLVSLTGWSTGLITILAICLATFITLLNFIGTKFSSKMQSVTTVIKFIPLILIVVFGLLSKSQTNISLWPLVAGGHKSFFTSVSSALLSALFAFDGWINVTNLAGEIKNPTKNLPRAIILGLGIITTIYVLINLTFLKTLPISQLMNNDNAAFQSAIKIFGSIGGKLVTIGILISVYGAINGFTLTGMRVPYTMARDNNLPFSNKISLLNRSTGVPVYSALIILAMSIILMLLGTFNLLTDMLVFVMWFFSTLISIAVLILRVKEPDLERPYKVLFYPVIPIISILGGIFIVVSTAINQLPLALVGALITMTGIPVYYYKNKKAAK